MSSDSPIRPSPRLRSSLRVFLISATAASAASAQVPVPELKPWIYQDSGSMVWKEHRFLETLANTVFAIGREMVTVPNQTGVYPEVLLCNFAHFDPPEGVTATTRRLARASIEGKGLQLYVNYSNALVDPADTSPVPNRYAKPTFFMSLDTNSQTIPEGVDYGFDAQTISATRAAFGVFDQIVPNHAQVMQVAPSRATGAAATLSAQVNAVFVTASIGYGSSDIDSQDTALATEARRARLMVRDAVSGIWIDQSTIVSDVLPASVTGGNSSGVVFADLNGDGYMDLYVGMQGDNYLGATDRILIFNHSTGKFVDETSLRIVGSTPLPANATNEVAAADVDNDGDLDIVSVGRQRRTGTAGTETQDCLLVNNGIGRFAVTPLAASANSDSRSVAIADLDGDTYPEIVIANAGGDTFSNDLNLPATQNHVMQIFKGTAGTSFVDVTTTFIASTDEEEVTAPWSLQVLAVDIYGAPNDDPPAKWSPDGYPELVIVNHRDILLSGSEAASNVHIVRNRGDEVSGNRLVYGTAYPTMWGQTVTVEDFMQTGALHYFSGAGNRFLGAKALVIWNDGPSDPPTQPDNYPFLAIDDTYDLLPATEHAYGFDFADYDENGVMDAGQCARGYDFLAKDIGQDTSHSSWHLDFTVANSAQLISNQRGKMNPRGGEDVCFAKFSAATSVNAIFVGQQGSSGTTPRSYPKTLRESAVVCVLEKDASPQGFLHEVKELTLSNGTTKVLGDIKIDENGRLASRRCPVADRVEVADMNNDGKPDAMVLYQGISEPSADRWVALESPEFPETPISSYLTGFSYLKNVQGDPGVPATTWFQDVAATSMKDSSGAYSKYWNRGLGAAAIADFNNDGRLDYYATSGRAVDSFDLSGGTDWVFENSEQMRDLLFLNALAPTAPGRLKETGATVLPPMVQEQIKDDFQGESQSDSAGSMFVTQGDIDNDGYADVIVTHINGPDRTALPSLYMNKYATTGTFTEEYIARVNPLAFSNVTVHSEPAVDFSNAPLYGGAVADATFAIALADIDGDGDQDMLCAVGGNAPRILRNRGQDSDGNGHIDPSDPLPSRLGYFTDVTDSAIPLAFAQNDAGDIQAPDLDGDGDFDLAIDSFLGNVSLWRNQLSSDGKPRVTSIWPRVGSICRNNMVIELNGKGLTGTSTVRFRYRNGTTASITGSAITVIDDRRVRVQLAATMPLGLAQIEVLAGTTWSTQYVSYFILE
jgi:hypothetical protein